MVSEAAGTGDSGAGGDAKCRESGRGVWRICPLWESSEAGGAVLGGCYSGCQREGAGVCSEKCCKHCKPLS